MSQCHEPLLNETGGGREGGREEGKEGGRKGGREGGRKGGRETTVSNGHSLSQTAAIGHTALTGESCFSDLSLFIHMRAIGCLLYVAMATISGVAMHRNMSTKKCSY